jgi:hypothetical protein
MARVEVSDTGTGLTPEECERLFTPYYTTKRHGTGLGLAIVQSVVSDHHGRISVESAPGSGTTFRIELLVRPPESEGEHDAGQGSGRSTGTNISRTDGSGSSSSGTKASETNGSEANGETGAEKEKEKHRRDLVSTKSTLGLND